jgi:hypothetical protein
MRPYLENPFTKIGLVEWLKCEGPELKPQYHEREREREKERERERSVSKGLVESFETISPQIIFSLSEELLTKTIIGVGG